MGSNPDRNGEPAHWLFWREHRRGSCARRGGTSRKASRGSSLPRWTARPGRWRSSPGDRADALDRRRLRPASHRPERASLRPDPRTKETRDRARATHLFEEPGALEEVARLATEWFNRYLGKRLTA